MRVIADHLKGATWLASQGLAPSNKEQGYVMRRLVRRAILKATELGIEDNFVAPLVKVIYDIYADSVLAGTDVVKITTILEHEENQFRKTLSRGLRELEKLAKYKPSLEGKDIFKLQDTYGFPKELAVEEIFARGLKLSENYRDEFESELKKQQDRSRTAAKGEFKGGLEDHGEMTVKYHTAAHLLLAALNDVLGGGIMQKGSNITSERLRFDFNHDEKLTDDEVAKIEAKVNQWIAEKLPVAFAEYDKNYARDTLHAHGQFWEKYPDKVTVYTIGDPDAPVSREICGGPHIKNTGELADGEKTFKITKEQSSSAGVRRIKAVLI
jgi:alanyl-tRNA synthetase